MTIKEKLKGSNNFAQKIKSEAVTLSKLDHNAWFIGSKLEQQLKEKIERLGKPLKEWDVKIYRGVLTGYNEAFIIDTAKRNEILSNCKDEDERQRTAEIIKPILRGRDIKRYHYDWADLWVIGTFPALRLDIDDYLALRNYFLENFDIRKLEQSGKKYQQLGFTARKKTGNKWFETQDQIAYYPEFEKEKVVMKNIGKNLAFTITPPDMFNEASCFMFTGKCLKYILGNLNSSFIKYYIYKYSDRTGAGDIALKGFFIEKLPIPPITDENKETIAKIENLVDKIIRAKKQDAAAETSRWEREIDLLVYKLYDLTAEECKVVDPDFEKVLSRFGLNKEDYERMSLEELAKLEVE